MVTCLVDAISPHVGECVVDVLEKVGVEIEVPEGQTCCGQPAFNGGFWDEARAMAMHTIEAFGDSDLPVVIPSGSCAYMIAHHYPELFEGNAAWHERAVRLSRRVHEFSEFLVDDLGVTDVGATFDGKLTYHASCHLLRGLQIHRQPLALLANVKGAELVPLGEQEECCGFGGLFSIKYGDISSEMLARKLDNIVATGARHVVGCDLSCLLNINGGLHRRKAPVTGVHIAEILAGKAG
ncbi:MAG TPA: (Fe-S)-binding protein [Chloroflexota bacterium]